MYDGIRGEKPNLKLSAVMILGVIAVVVSGMVIISIVNQHPMI